MELLATVAVWFGLSPPCAQSLFVQLEVTSFV